MKENNNLMLACDCWVEQKESGNIYFYIHDKKNSVLAFKIDEKDLDSVLKNKETFNKYVDNIFQTATELKENEKTIIPNNLSSVKLYLNDDHSVSFSLNEKEMNINDFLNFVSDSLEREKIAERLVDLRSACKSKNVEEKIKENFAEEKEISTKNKKKKDLDNNYSTSFSVIVLGAPDGFVVDGSNSVEVIVNISASAVNAAMASFIFATKRNEIEKVVLDTIDAQDRTTERSDEYIASSQAASNINDLTNKEYEIYYICGSRCVDRAECFIDKEDDPQLINQLPTIDKINSAIFDLDENEEDTPERTLI